jgi:putative ABC transport system permease protein
MDTLRQDLRFALRVARRAPGATAVIVLSVALGIGAVTTLLNLAYVLLVRPLPFTDPARIMTVWTKAPGQPSDPSQLSPMSAPEFLDFRRASASYASLGVYFPNYGWTLTHGGAERVQAALVSAEILPMLGVSPVLGRGIRPGDDRPTDDLVVVLGWDLWRRRFAADPKILGRTVRANGRDFRVIGVMPPGFAYPLQNEAWIPLWSVTPREGQRDLRRFSVLGRLRDGVTPEDAGREAASIARRLGAPQPGTGSGSGFTVFSLRAYLIPEALPPSLVLSTLAAVLSLFLIACANVASLLLAHAAERRREIAMRAALGAGTRRLARLLLTESLLLAVAGGTAGLGLAYGGVALLTGVLGPLPYGMEMRAELAVFAAGLVLALVAGVLFGLAPILQAVRLDLGPVLRDGGRASASRPARRLHTALVVAETAAAVVLVVAAALSLRSLSALRSADSGIVPERLLTTVVQLSSKPERPRRGGEIAARLAALPGIEAAAAADLVPLSLTNGQPSRLAIEGSPRQASAFRSAVTAGFFRTLGTPFVAGRDLTPEEGMTRSEVAVISASLARRLWPGGHAVGRRLRISGLSKGWLTVVGVTADFNINMWGEESQPAIYVSSAYNLFAPVGVLVRTELSRDSALQAIRRVVRQVDPDAPLFMTETMDELRDGQMASERLVTGGLLAIGGFALFFAALGTYGVLSFAVGRRRREIGIRLALGAQRWHVFRAIVGRGMVLTLLGLALGLLGALPAARTLSGRLYQVSPSDPLSFTAGAVVLLEAAFLACYLPARRALDLDPREALAAE